METTHRFIHFQPQFEEKKRSFVTFSSPILHSKPTALTQNTFVSANYSLTMSSNQSVEITWEAFEWTDDRFKFFKKHLQPQSKNVGSPVKEGFSDFVCKITVKQNNQDSCVSEKLAMWGQYSPAEVEKGKNLQKEMFFMLEVLDEEEEEEEEETVVSKASKTQEICAFFNIVDGLLNERKNMFALYNWNLENETYTILSLYHFCMMLFLKEYKNGLLLKSDTITLKISENVVAYFQEFEELVKGQRNEEEYELSLKHFSLLSAVAFNEFVTLHSYYESLVSIELKYDWDDFGKGSKLTYKVIRQLGLHLHHDDLNTFVMSISPNPFPPKQDPSEVKLVFKGMKYEGTTCKDREKLIEEMLKREGNKKKKNKEVVYQTVECDGGSLIEVSEYEDSEFECNWDFHWKNQKGDSEGNVEIKVEKIASKKDGHVSIDKEYAYFHLSFTTEEKSWTKEVMWNNVEFLDFISICDSLPEEAADRTDYNYCNALVPIMITYGVIMKFVASPYDYRWPPKKDVNNNHLIIHLDCFPATCLYTYKALEDHLKRDGNPRLEMAPNEANDLWENAKVGIKLMLDALHKQNVDPFFRFTSCMIHLKDERNRQFIKLNFPIRDNEFLKKHKAIIKNRDEAFQDNKKIISDGILEFYVEDKDDKPFGNMDKEKEQSQSSNEEFWDLSNEEHYSQLDVSHDIIVENPESGAMEQEVQHIEEEANLVSPSLYPTGYNAPGYNAADEDFGCPDFFQEEKEVDEEGNKEEEEKVQREKEKSGLDTSSAQKKDVDPMGNVELEEEPTQIVQEEEEVVVSQSSSASNYSPSSQDGSAGKNQSESPDKKEEKRKRKKTRGVKKLLSEMQQKKRKIEDKKKTLQIQIKEMLKKVEEYQKECAKQDQDDENLSKKIEILQGLLKQEKEVKEIRKKYKTEKAKLENQIDQIMHEEKI